MTPCQETRYLPILEPSDPRSLPEHVDPERPILSPLRPVRRGAAQGARWLRELAQRRDLIGHFCLPDPVLERLARRDPLGLRLAASAHVSTVVSIDTPLYGFMTAGQRERARARHLHRILRTLDAAPRLGLRIVPLVKALDADEMAAQLDLAHDAGLHDVAFYAREYLLERNPFLLRRFVRGALARKLSPIALGAASRTAAQWGPTTLAAQQHYVLARRGYWVPPFGAAVALDGAPYSPFARRFLVAGGVRSLTTHNFHQARQRLETATVPLNIGG